MTTLSALRAHLLESRICGDTKTTRENSVANAQKLAEGDPDKQLGMIHEGLTFEEAWAAVTALCGCDPDPSSTEGPGVIDPDLTLIALEAYGERLARAARNNERVLITTGHPTGPLPTYTAISRTLERRGCKILKPLDDVKLPAQKDEKRHRGNRVRFIEGVGLYADGASLYHTHSAWPMEHLLEACDPDLVLADHGFAGGAISRGVETVAFNDINDPSLAVAKARGMIDIVVPIDDNVQADLYAPITEYLVAAIDAAL